MDEKLEILLSDNRKLFVDTDCVTADFVNISEISSYFGMQNQYLSTHFNPSTASKQLGIGIRVRMHKDDYHSMEFHKEDIPKVMNRLKIHYASLWGEAAVEQRILQYYKYR